MKPDPYETEALRSLRQTLHHPTGPSGQHKEVTMQRVFASRSVSHRLSPRWLFGGGALCLLAGLSYATGLTRTISGWFVVEGFYLDPDSVPSQMNPELDSSMAISIDQVGVALDLVGGDPASLVVAPQEPITVEGFELLGTDGEALQAPLRRNE